MRALTMAGMSLEKKMTLILIATSAAALVLASSVLIAQHAFTARAQMLEDLSTLAEIVGNNSKPSLAFQYPDDGAEVLGSLKGKSTITAACLYDTDGEVFAVYANPVTGLAFEPPPPEADTHRLTRNDVVMFLRLVQNEEAVGTLLLKADLRPLNQRIRRDIVWAVGITLAAILLASLVASKLQHVILGQIRRIVDMANAIAAGDLPERLEVSSNDEIGELVASFNQMVETTKDVVRQTQTLARGDYSITFQPRSDKDELSIALIKMTEALRGFHEESARQDWLKTGLSELNKRMQGDPDLDTLKRNILDSLAETVDAQVGALYLAEEDRTLCLAAGFAYTPRLNQATTVRFGEGLVGQAARQQKMISVREIPDGECIIQTGIMEIVPGHLVILPLIREGQVIGVMEWGAARAFSPDQLDLLTQATEAIAIAIYSARARQRLTHLLLTTQEQSETLQQQQAALQQTNLELEERTRLLEMQKQQIHRQNQDLENARLDLERKARELAAASRYKSEFLANMSHELRTPLNSLLILSKLLAENQSGNLTEKQVEFAGTIHRAGSDLLTLINDILDLSKVEAGKLEFNIETVAVQSICSGVEGIFRHVAEEKNVAFTVSVEEGVAREIRTDPQRVGQILRNLLSNAFKFTSQGNVRLRVYRPAAGTFPGPAATVAFAVSDSGVGIPKEKQDMVFGAFQQANGTTSRDFGGTGLGLSISKALATRLGGDIVLESEPAKGSTFTLYLPARAPEDIAESPAAAAPVDSAPSRPVDDRADLTPETESLLVIEDDARFARIVVDAARAAGLKCLVATDGESGIALAAECRPSGIILDMMLPKTDGRTVLRRLKSAEATRSIPVHVISSLDPDQETMRMGAIGFLTKPVSLQQVESAIGHIRDVASKTRKKLLIIGQDAGHAQRIKDLFPDLPVDISVSPLGDRAAELVQNDAFDCVLLDVSLSDSIGHRLLQHIDRDREGRHVPVIVMVDRDPSRDEEAELRRHAQSIIVKREHADEHLLDQATLYLHVARPAVRKIAAVRPDPVSSPSVSRGDLKGKVVLIVDDDMRNAYSLAAAFAQEEIRNVVASNGQKALIALEENPDIDLVLMDIMMPGMDGYEATREIRKRGRFKDLPVIALTAKAMKGDREKCREAGATEYLAKPVDLDRLLDMMRSLLQPAMGHGCRNRTPTRK